MPIANVIRIMRRMLPPHAKISDVAKDAIPRMCLGVHQFHHREAENGWTSLPTILKRGIDHGRMIIPPFNSSAFQVGFRQGFIDATTSVIAGGYNRYASDAAAATGSSCQAPTNNFDFK
ncbi:hypothetical protein F3Y22_tig00116954pilonHSYRG00006 [Hibiscus syriacus]|uniref:Transcription factor CBF/NF-Y/archaeal histone domain-containing protein n=1 Tax=Hibiscus syriacus TaxID=106335 RepID=A0A6A2WM43_HIBSY|nr:hypothetical protein F3Y22_tig00116954pilonHSYRG00006 [Hibiscus syriacus]